MKMHEQMHEQFLAWKRTVERVTLHTAWPVPIELNVAYLRSRLVVLECFVHVYNASDVLVTDPLVPWADLPRLDILFSQVVPDIATTYSPECSEAARLRYVLDRLRETVLHEFDEFWLVDGQAVTSPHEMSRLAFLSMPSVKHDEISTWRAAITRVSLHPASRMHVDLGVEEDLQGRVTISCIARPSDSKLTMAVCHVMLARADTGHMQQLWVLARHTVQGLLDKCLIVDDIPLGHETMAILDQGVDPVEGAVARAGA